MINHLPLLYRYIINLTIFAWVSKETSCICLFSLQYFIASAHVFCKLKKEKKREENFKAFKLRVSSVSGNYFNC